MADDELVLEEAREQMEKSVESLHIDLGKIRTGRANPVLLESLEVDYYGADYVAALAHLADARVRLELLTPWDRAARARVELLAGAVYVGLGRKREALERFERAISFDPATTPDPEQTSPKVLSVFRTARQQGAKP